MVTVNLPSRQMNRLDQSTSSRLTRMDSSENCPSCEVTMAQQKLLDCQRAPNACLVAQRLFSFASFQVIMTEDSRGRLLLRIYADREEIDFDRVRKLLRLPSDEPEISRVTDEPDHDMLVVEFREQLTPFELGSVKNRGVLPFGNATSWLRRRPEESFKEIVHVGLRAGIAIGGSYWGPVPDDFLREVVRCGLGLYIM